MLSAGRKKRVVVTGVGPLSAVGIGKKGLWESILTGIQGVSYEKFFMNEDCVESSYIYKVKDFDIRNYGIDKNALNEIRIWKKGGEIIDLYYLLCVIKLALCDSKLGQNVNKKIGMVLAHEQPGTEQFLSDLINVSFDVMKSSPNLTRRKYFNVLNSQFSRMAYDQQTFMFLFHIARVFKIHNFSLFINNACASGLYAIETASQLIKSGMLDVAIVAAVDSPNLFRCLWLKENKLYSEDGKIRPFDSERNGFVCGEGGAALILEDFDSAKKRNARIYAEYMGGGFVMESWKVTLPHVKEGFYSKAIKQSLTTAGVNPGNVDLINAHGVGTNIIDQYEANAIRQVFKKNGGMVPVNAFKPYVGHTLGASALLETAILLISMENNLIVPTLNTNRIDGKLKINVITSSQKKLLKTVLKLSCGFGGFDGSVVFKKV